MTRAIIYLTVAFAAGAAGWLAAGEFVQRVAITDAMRIAASGVLLLLFISGLSVDAQGHIIAAEFAVAAPEEPAS